MKHNGHTAGAKKSARLVVKKETIRQLRTLDDSDLRAVNGGAWITTILPSCHGC
jgi:hypothetical protein